jgi:hypothetical protein
MPDARVRMRSTRRPRRSALKVHAQGEALATLRRMRVHK